MSQKAASTRFYHNAIGAEILKLIEHEAEHGYLSDENLAQKITAGGIPCSLMTVRRVRQEIGIPMFSERRKDHLNGKETRQETNTGTKTKASPR